MFGFISSRFFFLFIDRFVYPYIKVLIRLLSRFRQPFVRFIRQFQSLDYLWVDKIEFRSTIYKGSYRSFSSVNINIDGVFTISLNRSNGYFKWRRFFYNRCLYQFLISISSGYLLSSALSDRFSRQYKSLFRQSIRIYLYSSSVIQTLGISCGQILKSILSNRS